ncbi:MAG: hypothetical protein JWQ95_617 [Sphaerisporangium sp.]|jgi:hypothetical protein|nr:hypothetical protein [Sphaerisporangium sp.]
MMKRLVMLAALVAVGVMVYQSIPDIKRYMQIRSM